MDRNKPLLGHTKIDYDECCAKLTLEDLFPERYGELKLSDKPDLQGKDVGIEVTIANDRKIQEALNNWITAYHTEDEKIKKRCIDRMAQLGVKYTGGVQSWPLCAVSFDLTKKSIDSKISKLKKGGYLPFPRYELFIFTDTWFYDEILDEAKQYMFRKEISDYYKTIYVFSEGIVLHVFETDLCLYKKIQIETTEQTKRNCRARELIEEAENDS